VDIGPRYAGPLMGLSNTSGALAGVLANLVTGFLLDATGSWQLVFAVFVSSCSHSLFRVNMLDLS
jgi:nitrate/nitrite transporter NarK